MKTMSARLTFAEECLGTKADNPDVFADFIASKHPDGTPAKDELDSAEHRESAGTTVFHRDEQGRPILWNYQIKGFFKDACSMMRRATDSKSSDLKAYKSVIDGCIFVKERKIHMVLPDGQQVGIRERPIRCETAQGPRVSLIRSETVPPGTTLCITIQVLQDGLVPYIREWLDYWALRGIGQWRNSGTGTFTWEELDK